jgi:hypothetical protein
MTYQQLLWPESVAVGAVLGCQDHPSPVVERTNQPTPAATQATLDGRSAPPQKFLLSDPIVALPSRLPLGAREGRPTTPRNGMTGRRMGAGKSFASDYQHQFRTLRRPAEWTKIEASWVAIRGIVEGVA